MDAFVSYLSQMFTQCTHMAHLLGVGCGQGAKDAAITGFDACLPTHMCQHYSLL